jgi:glycine hydroxymethyltransferase
MCKEKWAKALDKTIFPGLQGGPLMHVIAAKAVSFKEALDPSFKVYQQNILNNAQALASALKERGFRLITGGTDNHLMLVDVRNKKVTGKVAEKALDKAGITANKNTIPNDPESPFVTSGLRLGTPAVTTRGMGTSEMVKIAEFIDRALTAPDSEGNLAQIKKEVVELCARFPFYK